MKTNLRVFNKVLSMVDSLSMSTDLGIVFNGVKTEFSGLNKFSLSHCKMDIDSYSDKNVHILYNTKYALEIASVHNLEFRENMSVKKLTRDIYWNYFEWYHNRKIKEYTDNITDIAQVQLVEIPAHILNKIYERTDYLNNPYEYTVLIKFLEPKLAHFKQVETENEIYNIPVFMYSSEYMKEENIEE